MSRPMCASSAKGGSLLVDTDVLIWLLRGRESARAALHACSSVEVSTVTYMELVQGATRGSYGRCAEPWA